MQNIIWGILLLAFIVDVFRRSLLNNEKNKNEITDKENNNTYEEKILNPSKINFFIQIVPEPEITDKMQIKIEGEPQNLEYDLGNKLRNPSNSGIERNLMLNIKYW